MAADSPAAKQFRQNVRMILSDRGMTMKELADAIDSKPANISRILAGLEAVTIARAEKIARALRTPLPELLEKREKIAT